MGMMTLRIPNEMRKEMAQIKINWSDYLRRSITEALESEHKRQMIQRVHQLLKNKKRLLPAGTASQLIRSMRDARTHRS